MIVGKSLLFSSVVAALVSISSLSAGTASALPRSPFAVNPVWCGVRAAVGLSTSGTGCEDLTFGVAPNRSRSTLPHSTPYYHGNTTNRVPLPHYQGNPTYRSPFYAALGDSVAAGAGLPAGMNGRSTYDSRCGRSSEAYPALVSDRLGVPLLNASCSGATVGDLVTGQRVSGPDIPAQLDTAFANGTPELMTITAGANDVHWIGFIRACYTSDCTRPSYDLAADAALAVLKAKLTYALYDIYQRSGGKPPEVIVTGYYNPLSAGCADGQAFITDREIAQLTVWTDRLNQTIQNTSEEYSFATFAPVNFSGHDICSQEPWVQGLSDPAPFHPTATGQAVIANAVVSAEAVR